MEEDFFLKKMKGVKVIKNRENLIKNKNTKDKEVFKKITKKNISNSPEKAEKKQDTNTEYKISFGDINKDLKKGRIKIDRRLDLHGHTLLQAEDRFKKVVIEEYKKNKRCLLVITGKGVHVKKTLDNLNEDHPKLYYGKIKNSIISWINDSDLKKYILTYQDAGFEHGADGALFVYLRKKKN